MCDKNLISPCGINCTLCIAYQRKTLNNKNKKLKICDGCRNKKETKCIIINCERLKNTESKFCYECEKFTCRRIKQLYTRYKNKYNVDIIENLNIIKEKGIKYFFDRDYKKWKCSNCDKVVCMHRNNDKKLCLHCIDDK
ncbi:DUF3795 domain-containing protein [Brachyspira pulli]|uniref:DUF3795 domain-containing protein n=1 Tax=Brachyspira pulli TaxID=310721 RepID=UPI0030054957